MLKYHVGLCPGLRRADSVVRNVEVDDGSSSWDIAEGFSTD